MPHVEECTEAAALTSGGSEFVSSEVTKSERPELATACVVVSARLERSDQKQSDQKRSNQK
eukprot:3405511-Pyramimonas_sp.AAC.1